MQIIGLWSAPDVANWYPRLRKPRGTPPVLFFPAVWSALYSLMGVAAHRVWQAGAGPGVLGLYVVQLAMNLAWQPLVRCLFCGSGDYILSYRNQGLFIDTI